MPNLSQLLAGLTARRSVLGYDYPAGGGVRHWLLRTLSDGCIGILLCLLAVGCGFVPAESKLVGTWQVDLPASQKIIYAFEKDHTSTMSVAGGSGAIQGTWKLEGSGLTTRVGSFAAYGMTNPLPVVTGFSNQKTTVVRLTDSVMVWRSGLLDGNLKFRRVKPAR